MASTVGEPQVFKYERPEAERGKTMVGLFRTDIAVGFVQVLKGGGENNLHAHHKMDGFWFVLGGRARFYTEGDRLIADLGPHEGVLIPRGYKYWFESVGDEPLELLQVESFAQRLVDNKEILADRTDYTPREEIPGGTRRYKAGLPERSLA
jgi:mannose-6-phosphate isomerase-like protein (cupin superfamily)